ncbi:MAG: type II secretion system protein [Verrucomicrobiota bacterium JB022]|nr:type II secretion system protein [Verrucomicrobiota bacterium JB022]
MRRGFSLLEIVVVLALVTGLLGGALWVWQASPAQPPPDLEAPKAWEAYLANARQLAQARGRPVCVAIWSDETGLYAEQLILAGSEWEPEPTSAFAWSGVRLTINDADRHTFSVWAARGEAQVIELNASGQPVHTYTWRWADGTEGRWEPGGLPQQREVAP